MLIYQTLNKIIHLQYCTITESSNRKMGNRKPASFNSGNRIASILGIEALTPMILLKHCEIIVCNSRIFGLHCSFVVPSSGSTLTVMKGVLQCNLYRI